MRALALAALCFVLHFDALAGAGAAEKSAPPPPYVVIVNPKNPVRSLDRTFLQDAFLKKTRYWPGEAVIQPVDLPPASSVRGSFTQQVLGRSVAAVRAYWQQRIFSGRDVPPPELTNDERVIEYVLSHEGAVAYVSGTTPLTGAKAVTITK